MCAPTSAKFVSTIVAPESWSGRLASVPMVTSDPALDSLRRDAAKSGRGLSVPACSKRIAIAKHKGC